MRFLVVVLLVGMLALGAFAVAATVLPDPRPAPVTGFSHEQLEADRLMTQRMGSYLGPGMDAVMPANGMVARSQSPAYLRALEQHQYEIDRMVGLTP